MQRGDGGPLADRGRASRRQVPVAERALLQGGGRGQEPNDGLRGQSRGGRQGLSSLVGQGEIVASREGQGDCPPQGHRSLLALSKSPTGRNFPLQLGSHNQGLLLTEGCR